MLIMGNGLPQLASSLLVYEAMIWAALTLNQRDHYHHYHHLVILDYNIYVPYHIMAAYHHNIDNMI